MRVAQLSNYWKEGLSYKYLDQYADDILGLWKEGNVRYWKMADSYILTDIDRRIPIYNVYCITKPFFHEYFKI